MAFHDVRFPLDIALGARGGPERLTDIVTLSSGAEERNSRWANSRHRYNAGYGVKSLADMQAVLAFFEERRGRFHSFLWRDGLDFSSNGGNGTPTPLDQTIGTGDGTKTTFQLVSLGATSRVVLTDAGTLYRGIVQTAQAYAPGLDPEAPIASLAQLVENAIPAGTGVEAILDHFEQHGADDLAVVDKDGRVIGILTEKYVNRRYIEESEKAQHELFGD